MSKLDQNESRSKQDLTNLYKQLEKLRQTALPNAPVSNSQTPGSVLQALLTIDFPIKNVGDQKFIDVIVMGSKNLSYEVAPFKDFCHLICKVFSKQIKPSVLKQSAYNCVVTFLLGNFNATPDAEIKVDSLRALSIILYDNPHNNSKNLEDLVPLLIKVADKSTRPLEVRRMAINCLGNICCNAGPKLQPYYSAIFEVIMSNISNVDHTLQGTTLIVAKSLDFNDQALRRVASSTLRSLQLLLYEDKSIITNKLVDTVEIVRTFVFYNINSTTYKNSPNFMHSKEDTQLNSMQLLPHQQRLSHLRHQEQNKRLSAILTPFNSLSVNREFGAFSSDSEISDSEAINPGSRKHRDNAKIRINALLCLQAIAKTSPRSFYPYWENFIPHNFDPFTLSNRAKSTTNDTHFDCSLASYLSYIDHPQSLFTILLFDPAPTVRLAVSNALMSILDGSKQYLSVAAERDAKSTSFTSLSEKVAAIARDLHNGLWCALELETNATITIQLFKCFSLLIQNSSYDRLAKGYVAKIYKKLMQYIDNPDPRIAISALSALYSLLDNKSAAEDIRNCVGSIEPTPDLEHPPIESMQVDVNLFSYIKAKIVAGSQAATERSESANFALECWNILSACTRTQPLWLPQFWKIAQPSFPDILLHDDIAVRCSAVRFLNSYANALNERTQGDADTQMTLSWWTTVIERYLQQATQDSDYQVRALACDCMSVISQDTFESMAPRRQRLGISLLLPLTEDLHVDVRAAACHALGALVVFPSLREDPMFTSDVALAMLQHMDDKSLFVKVRASWTLANLCDALVLEHQNNEDFSIKDTLSLELWCKVTSAAASAANDNDKLKSNGVRALGSVTRIAPLDYLASQPGRRCISPIVAAVTKNIESGTLKARWNACHAAGNILRNPNFPIGSADNNRWTVPFYEALMKSLKQCKNFKVRIHACAALGTPTQKSQYGTSAMFAKVINSVRECLQEIDQDLPDISFMEMRYKEQLKEQLETTLAQLDGIE